MTAITMTDAMIKYRTSKLGNVQPATRAKCVEIIQAAAKSGHDIWFCWGAGGGEHSVPPGLALDLMVKNEAAGDWVRNYIWANRVRLRLRHVIWEKHITSTVTLPGVRRLMADRGNTTANHMDHNHVRFLEGAYVSPAASGNASSIPEEFKNESSPTLARGSNGPRVKVLQESLKAVLKGYAGKLAVDGSFGPDLERVVMEFQTRNGLEVDGRVGPATRAELLKYKIDVSEKTTSTPAPAPKPATTRWTREDVKSMQRILRSGVDGKWGPATEARAKAFRAVAADSVTHTDRDVRLVQKILGLTVDGSRGLKTRAILHTRVTLFQGILKVSEDGKWGPGTDRAYNAFHNEWRGK